MHYCPFSPKGIMQGPKLESKSSCFMSEDISYSYCRCLKTASRVLKRNVYVAKNVEQN